MLRMYKYTTSTGQTCAIFGTILAVVSGICVSVLNALLGNIMGRVVEYVTIISNTNNTIEIENAQLTLMDDVTWFSIESCILGIVVLLLTYGSTVSFNYNALSQTFRIRQLFFQKVLNQDIVWFDLQQGSDFASCMADDLKKIEDGIGEKMSILVFNGSVAATSIVLAIILGWELALVCFIALPISIVMMGFLTSISAKLTKQETKAFGEAAVIAEETLQSIRTVAAFEGQVEECKRYAKRLLTAMNINIKRSLFSAVSGSILWFFIFGGMALAFWYGVKIMQRDLQSGIKISYSSGTIASIFYFALDAMWRVAMSLHLIEIINTARGAAAKIRDIIESTPVINASKGMGVRPNLLSGKITFKDVYFNYPSRPEVQVLRGLTLTIEAGETVALVGSSGSGKSTCILLLQRLYDPLKGMVYLDDNNLTDLDVSWVRQRMGIVGQEPVLFSVTIAENIKLGHADATQDDIETAAIEANAHDFIIALPQGYNTVVGERGTQLSGGQKQRIAIARALIRKPTILLLDEATSALDSNSEAIVQAALESSKQRTTIIVAHRLSSVRNVDRIVVICEGKVVEQGTHDELIELKRAYYKLVAGQLSHQEYPQAILDTLETADDVANYNHGSFDLMLNRKLLDRMSIDDVQINSKVVSNSTASSLCLVMKYNSKEWWLIIIGCLCSLANGVVTPVYSILFGRMMKVLSHGDINYIEIEVNRYCVYVVIIAIVMTISIFLQAYTFGVAGEKLTNRLRIDMFKCMLYQELAWFDDKANGVGSLCARLSGEAASVQGAVGQRIGSALTAISTAVVAIAISLYFEWRIALLGYCFAIPTILLALIEDQLVDAHSEAEHSSLLKSTKIAVEAISSIQTVASQSCENVFYNRYVSELKPYAKTASANAHYRGLMYGFGRSMLYFSNAACFYLGVILIRNENLDYSRLFTVSECLVVSAWYVGTSLAFIPNFQKGLIAVNRIFQLLRRTSQIRNYSDNIDERWEKCDINYNDVRFRYPTRPNSDVLNGLDLSILHEKTVALVGPSGCGKSSIVQLLQRFYDPCSGNISANGSNIKRMNISALRSQLGIVSQEPNLFHKTLAENIAYGDNSRTVTMDEIIEAARNANINTFIKSLPLGYDTVLGEKGTHLSGGQKQRVAIARALIRNPKILILDEATSALDVESEKVVQEAMDIAMKGRTCITIAHRLTTIQNADIICVISRGKIIETGTHSHLINIRGVYYNLYRKQEVVHE